MAWPLLAHVEIHKSDARFRAVAALLAEHQDEAVRAEAAALARGE